MRIAFSFLSLSMLAGGRSLTTLAGVLSLSMLAGCSLFDSSSSTVDTVTLAATTTDGETGTATLTNTGASETQVAISTTGDGTTTDVQSAAIRAGACGDNGDIYQELNNVQGDSSVTVVDVELSSLEGSKYSIEIHSATDVNTIVACGAIP